jgi:hypothetical protein
MALNYINSNNAVHNFEINYLCFFRTIFEVEICPKTFWPEWRFVKSIPGHERLDESGGQAAAQDDTVDLQAGVNLTKPFPPKFTDKT